jgi:hypothetical protein
MGNEEAVQGPDRGPWLRLARAVVVPPLSPPLESRSAGHAALSGAAAAVLTVPSSPKPFAG